MADLLGIGTSGLLATQRALNTASHNIANVNTEGYSRQRVLFDTRTPTPYGSGFLGNGVNVTSIERTYDQFVNEQVRTYTTVFNQLETFHALTSQVDNMLADPAAGLTPALEDFFNAVQEVSDDPTSTTARQVLLSNGEALVSRFESIDQRMESLYESANQQVYFVVDQVNSYANQIASINDQILLATGTAGGAEPNDLLDKRDLLLTKLSELVSVSTTLQEDGRLNVFIGNGQPLVVGSKASELAVTKNNFLAERNEITFSGTGGTAVITDTLKGGVLAGVVDFIDQVLDPARNALGRIAIGVSDAFNRQHQLGQDLNGNLGGLFFNDLSTTSPEVYADITNTGTGTLSATITDIGALKVSDYRLDYDGANYTLTRLSDGSSSTFGALPIDVTTTDGFTINLTAGAVAAGDSFLIRPTFDASYDIDMDIALPEQIAMAAPIIGQEDFANTGSGKISAGSVDTATQPPLNPDLQQPVTITFTGPGTFDVTGVGAGLPAIGVAYTPGADISYNGWTVQIEGSPVAGDVFTVSANTTGVGDNRNGLALAALQGNGLLNNGTASLQSAYGEIVGDVGVKAHQADVNIQAQDALLRQAVQSRESISGVNLDEEAANLVKFQQAYQASAQVISIANQLFQDLIASFR
ncbi:MAG: flagellar hook-associated protein FlgK [Thioalkalispiraceae bacterium]|jgi:flagellar hook-associated protein 1 FlgK